ncbi:MAG: hypothetical protein WCQ53_02860, partial [bacterium]
MDKRRLFWGFEVDAKWPELPKDGRIVEPGSRHATMLFLGEVDYEVLKPFIDTYKPDISATPSGVLDKLLFLPNKKKPRVVSIGGYLNEPAPCLNEIKRVKKEMELLGFKTEDREWLLHIT